MPVSTSRRCPVPSSRSSISRYAQAAAAQTTIQNAFSATTGGLGPTVRVTADPRTSSLIVQAGPRDMAAVADLIRQIDVIEIGPGGPVSEVRIVGLEHTLAQEIVSIMQSAILGPTGVPQGAANQQGGQFNQGGQPGGPGGPGGAGGPGAPGGPGGQPGGFGQGQNVPGTPGANPAQNAQRQAMLRFLMVDARGRRLLNSGILT